MMVPLSTALGSAAEPALGAVLASWQWRPDVATVLTGIGAAYVAGWIRLRRRHPAAARRGSLGLYLTGLLVIVLALLSPIDMLADRLLTMHMVQHELLTLVAAPLLALGDPLRAVIWALPHALRRRVGTLLAWPARPRRLFAVLTFMPVAWLLYMAVLWGAGTFRSPTRPPGLTAVTCRPRQRKASWALAALNVAAGLVLAYVMVALLLVHEGVDHAL
jgi:hypothetical protein